MRMLAATVVAPATVPVVAFAGSAGGASIQALRSQELTVQSLAGFGTITAFETGSPGVSHAAQGTSNA